MKQTTYTTRVLIPEEGHYITQAEEVDIIHRIFSNKIFLAVNDSPSNWKEITADEAEILMAAQKAALEEEANNEESN